MQGSNTGLLRQGPHLLNSAKSPLLRLPWGRNPHPQQLWHVSLTPAEVSPMSVGLGLRSNMWLGVASLPHLILKVVSNSLVIVLSRST